VIVAKPSRGTVEETVERLEGEIARRGLKLFTVIDHSGRSGRSGSHAARHQVVVFGSPVAGTAVMEAVPLAALDLPLKVLVWDDGGETKLAYLAPAELAERYGLDEELAARLAGIEPIAAAAAG